MAVLPIKDRFLRHVDKGDGCWLWRGGRRKYARFRMGGRGEPEIGAHVAAYILFVGPVPPGMYVCHHCDVPRCVRPDHLFLGTPLDNVQDCVRKGRWVRGNYPDRHGEKANSSKLVTAQVIEIRRRARAGEKAPALAVEFGISRRQADNIITGRHWAHISLLVDA